MDIVALPSRNGPALWDSILEALGFEGAVIAGGCIRDYHLGLEPKDIDIFVPVPNRLELEDLMDRLNDSSLWQLSLIETGNEGEYEEAFDGILIGVIEGEFCNMPVNIISRSAYLDGCDEPDLTSLIESFDYGILQAAYDGRAIIATPAQSRDHFNREATLLNRNYYSQSIARFERFNERNPGVLRFVDPENRFARN